MNEIKEEFELFWITEKQNYGPFPLGMDEYFKDVSFSAWKASRESLVVDLPSVQFFEGGTCSLYDAEDVMWELDKLGVSYK